MSKDLFWIAQRHGQERHNKDVIRAVDLLRSVIGEVEWSRRLDSIRERFENGKKTWGEGHFARLFDPTDAIGVTSE